VIGGQRIAKLVGGINLGSRHRQWQWEEENHMQWHCDSRPSKFGTRQHNSDGIGHKEWYIPI